MSNEAEPGTPRKGFSCLIVEDDPAFGALLDSVVQGFGGVSTLCRSIRDATRVTTERSFDLLLLDNHLPDGRTFEFYSQLCRRNPEALAVMITGMADLTEAIQLTRNGLFDYLPKPVGIEALEACLHRALTRLHARPGNATDSCDLGQSSSMREVRRQLAEAARHVEAWVLLTGESGVGKDVAVRILHEWTYPNRADAAPYVPLNCAAVPAEMFEAELFGAERGAYTGADRRRSGLVAAAQGGTLFLDEIGEVPLTLQPKLLRFLESREYRSLGGTTLQRFTGRLVAATNRNLRAEVEAGRFREDLLYRIEVFHILLPPLRERRDDIPTLTENLLRHLASKYRRSPPLVREEDMRALQRHPFPGNVRELRNILERSLLRTPEDQRWLALEPAWTRVATPVTHTTTGPIAEPIAPPPPSTSAPSPPLPPDRSSLSPLEAQEYQLIRSTLAETGGGIRRSAAKLGLSPQALLRRLEKWPELRPPTP